MTAKLTSLHWGVAKDFFDEALLARQGTSSTMLLPQQAIPKRASLQATIPTAVQLPSLLGEIRKILDNLPLPHPSLQAPNLNINLIARQLWQHELSCFRKNGQRTLG